MKNPVCALLVCLLLAITPNLFAQNVSINADGSAADTSAMLDVSSTTKGFLLPRLTTTQQNSIVLPATGLTVFNTTLNSIMVNTGTSISPVWAAVTAGSIDTSSIANFSTKVRSLFSSTTPITYSNGLIGVTQSGTSTNGYLSSADWNTFNNKAAAFSSGNLTETGSGVLTITGGTGSVIGSGTTVQVKQATTSQSGFLSNTDWNTFNNKLSTIDTTNITSFSIKVRSLFSSTAPITYSNGLIGITQASTSTNGYLSSTDWNTFNSKGSGNGTVTSVSVVSANGVSGTVATSTTTPAITLTLGAITPTSVAATGTVTGSNLSGTNTGNVTIGTANGLSIAGQALSMALSGTSTTGTLSSTDWNTFNNKAAAFSTGNLTETGSGVLTITGGTGSVIGTGTTVQVKQATTSQNGFLTSTDWNAFNNKQPQLNGTGFVKATGTTISYDNSTYLTANQTISFSPSGDVTGSTTGTTTIAPALVIGTNKVLNTMLAQMPTLTIKGNNTGGTANPSDLTVAQVNAILPVFTSTLNGLVPFSGGSAGKVLHADGIWRDTASAGNQWSITGNSGTSYLTNFIGTTDNKSFRFRTNNTQRMKIDSTGSVAIGQDTFDPTNPEKVIINAGSTGSVNGLVVKGTIDNYFQFNIKNQSATANATTDIVATADNGTETTNYVDLGINGSAYTGGAIQTGIANDGYLISAANDFYLVNSTPNKNLLFLTGGTGVANERLRILANGYVGLGVQDPGAQFVVKDTIQIRRTGAVSQLLFTNTAGSGDFRIGGDGGDLFWQGGGGRDLQMGSYWATILTGDRQTSVYPGFISNTSGTGVIVLGQRDASVPLGIQANSATQSANLTEWRNSSGTVLSAVDNSGNFGIGNSSPSQQLDVTGNVKFSGALMPNNSAGTAGYVLTSNGAGSAPSWSSVSSSSAWALGGNSVASVQNIGTTSNYDFPFITNNTEKMRLTSAGSLGIGTTTFNATYPERLLADAGSTGNTNYQNVIVGKGNTNSYAQLNIQNNNAGTNASSDVVATSNDGNEISNYIDMGINSSSNTSSGIIGAAHTGYLYTTGNDFAIGNSTSGKNLIFFTSGTAAANEAMRIDGNGNMGIETTSPKSVLEVNGAMATTISKQSGASTVTLDNTASVWYFTTGSGSIALPTASTCTNRRYVIVNRNASSRTISSFSNLSGTGTTTIAANSSIEIISDGSNWLQIK